LLQDFFNQKKQNENKLPSSKRYSYRYKTILERIYLYNMNLSFYINI